jgi:hypothetical protein
VKEQGRGLKVRTSSNRRGKEPDGEGEHIKTPKAKIARFTGLAIGK